MSERFFLLMKYSEFVSLKDHYSPIIINSNITKIELIDLISQLDFFGESLDLNSIEINLDTLIIRYETYDDWDLVKKYKFRASIDLIEVTIYGK